MPGRFFELGASGPYRHDRVWVQESTTGPDRLRIGGGDSPVELLVELARDLQEPLFILTVLRVPRQGDAARLESEAVTP